MTLAAVPNVNATGFNHAVPRTVKRLVPLSRLEQSFLRAERGKKQALEGVRNERE